MAVRSSIADNIAQLNAISKICTAMAVALCRRFFRLNVRTKCSCAQGGLDDRGRRSDDGAAEVQPTSKTSSMSGGLPVACLERDYRIGRIVPYTALTARICAETQIRSFGASGVRHTLPGSANVASRQVARCIFMSMRAATLGWAKRP